MSTVIYYFSGTGNSMFAAKELQKRIPGSSILPIAGMLDKKEIRTTADSVGIVFPVHGQIPVPVKEFIQKTDFSSADYVFAVATRRGTPFRGFEEIDKLLKKNNKCLNAHFALNMYSNDVQQKGYTVPTREAVAEIEKNVLNQLDVIQNIIQNKQSSREEDRSVTVTEKQIPASDKFFADIKCTGCGLCRKVCLSGKITMLGGKPEWQKKVPCYMCFACLNYCPRQAVQIKGSFGAKSYTAENGRYPHPYAAANDIAAQKETV